MNEQDWVVVISALLIYFASLRLTFMKAIERSEKAIKEEPYFEEPAEGYGTNPPYPIPPIPQQYDKPKTYYDNKYAKSTNTEPIENMYATNAYMHTI